MSIHLFGTVPLPKADDAPSSATGFFDGGKGGGGSQKSSREFIVLEI